jgi:hypothetical protein
MNTRLPDLSAGSMLESKTGENGIPPHTERYPTVNRKTINISPTARFILPLVAAAANKTYFLGLLKYPISD